VVKSGSPEIDKSSAEWAPYINWGERLEAERVITTPAIIRAFKTIRRYDFLTDDVKHLNAENRGLPIGYDQQISQPSAVGKMLEWLSPRPGNRVLDEGSGSGFTTAMLGKIVGRSGYVIGNEIVPELAQFGRNNIARYNFPNVEIRQAYELGLPREDKFNRILVSAHMPHDWVDELSQQLSRRGGRMVAPIIPDKHYGDKEAHACEMVSVTRHGKEFETTVLDKGWYFVPLINEADERFILE